MPVGAPLDRIATDILGPLPITPRGNKYILVVTDYFTKWVEVFPVPDQTAVTCAQIILNDVICRFGCPLSIHSDQGRNYESQVFQELCEILEIRKTRTTPRNPKCNGQVERFNRSLLSMIKSFLRGEQTNWDMNLGCLVGAYRASPHESTGFTPTYLC
jgi:transposase InsO family protein